MSAKPAKYSPTKLSTYRRCPRQFEFQYVHKIPRAPTAAMTFGATLHRTLEGAVQKGEDAARTIERLQAEWSSAGFASAQEEAAFKALGEAIVADFHAKPVEGVPLLLEKRLNAPHRGTLLWGIVDRVDQRPDGTLELVDYKSTRFIARHPDELDPDVHFQLGIYHHLVRSHFPLSPISRWSVHYLRTNERLSFLPAPEAIEALIDEAAQNAQAIETATHFPPRPGDACAYCPYLRRCGTGRRHLDRHDP